MNNVEQMRVKLHSLHMYCMWRTIKEKTMIDTSKEKEIGLKHSMTLQIMEAVPPTAIVTAPIINALQTAVVSLQKIDNVLPFAIKFHPTN
jgi:hypothetical protein